MKRYPSGYHLRSQAFSIMEMMGVLMILSLFLLLAAQLFSRATSVIGGSHNAIEQHQTAQGMFHLLRQDMWLATEVTLASESMLTLTTPEGETVTWTIERPHTLLRTAKQAGDDPARNSTWHLPAKNLRFEWQHAALVVRDEERGRDREATFPNGWRLAQQLQRTAKPIESPAPPKEQP